MPHSDLQKILTNFANHFFQRKPILTTKSYWWKKERWFLKMRKFQLKSMVTLHKKMRLKIKK